MKIVLCGQRRFGCDTLQLCQRLGHEIAVVYCPVDPADKLRIYCENTGLPAKPAGTLRAHAVPPGTDLIVAAHSHDFISRPERFAARLGAIGYHPVAVAASPRPRRAAGRSDAGERVTGASIYLLNDTVDGGPIAARAPAFIRPTDDARSLWSRELAPLGLLLFEKVLRDLAAGIVVREAQDHSLATWEPALSDVPSLHRPELSLLPYDSAGRQHWRLMCKALTNSSAQVSTSIQVLFFSILQPGQFAYRRLDTHDTFSHTPHGLCEVCAHMRNSTYPSQEGDHRMDTSKTRYSPLLSRRHECHSEKLPGPCINLNKHFPCVTITVASISQKPKAKKLGQDNGVKQSARSD